jgi:uridine kinase
MLKAFVGPMTPLNIDAAHYFPEHDLRLIRHIIRDDKTRGHLSRAFVQQWTSVRTSEKPFITSNIKSADMFFNSALVDELAVLSAVGMLLFQGALAPLEDEPVELAEVTCEVK